jgi:hypothetical protein
MIGHFRYSVGLLLLATTGAHVKVQKKLVASDEKTAGAIADRIVAVNQTEECHAA